MILFPNAKINLGLNITRKREDGYHDLETVFYPLQIRDAIEVIEVNNAGNETEPFRFSHSGNEIQGTSENNLCYKAWHLLKRDFPGIPPIAFHLHKAIPMGAGMGGGSADASFTLMLLNKKFNLGINEAQLIDYALALGSDCPFFILNKPVLAKGRGEIMESLHLSLKGYYICIVFPHIHISTPWAFKQIKPAVPDMHLDEIITQPLHTWKALMKNDFESAVFTAYPEIGSIKKQLYDAGAQYASLSGSGSTVFGIFEKEDFPLGGFPEHYFVKKIALA
jgi:4-diphosphocytidyl-2-C-methyl-D-erythritol kinase